MAENRVKVLFVGTGDSPVSAWLREQGEDVLTTSDRITPQLLEDGYSHLVSHGYRHIVSPDILEHFGDNAINLHISWLPWNRGADPNLWSFIDDTPRGVSIHVMSAGLDRGELVARSTVELDATRETFASSYAKLQQAVLNLFREQWPAIRAGEHTVTTQEPGGSYHNSSDKQAYLPLLTEGWDTNIASFLNRLKDRDR